MCETEKQQVSFKILSYLADNPGSQDTLEGVVEWWLLEQKIKDSTAKAKEALADLVRRGLVLERNGTDARSRYRVNRRKLHKIREILERGLFQ